MTEAFTEQPFDCGIPTPIPFCDQLHELVEATGKVLAAHSVGMQHCRCHTLVHRPVSWGVSVAAMRCLAPHTWPGTAVALARALPNIAGLSPRRQASRIRRPASGMAEEDLARCFVCGEVIEKGQGRYFCPEGVECMPCHVCRHGRPGRARERPRGPPKRSDQG